MLYTVRFHDKPGASTLRQALLPAHLQWLEDHQDVVLVGGSLREAPGTPAVGGLWVVEAPDRATIEALLRTDPFWTGGLRQSHEIHHWTKAFPDRKVPV